MRVVYETIDWRQFELAEALREHTLFFVLFLSGRDFERWHILHS